MPRLPEILLILGCAVSAAAQEPALQLLDNPGGESSVAIRVGQSGGRTLFDLPGWESVSGDWVAQNAPWSKVDAKVGGSFLRPRAGGDVALLRQTVDLAPAGVPRPRFLIAGAWARTLKGKDACELRVVLHDEVHADLTDVVGGPWQAKEWTWREILIEVPTSAVRATIELRGICHDGKFADAFFDDAVLEGFGPGRPVGFAKLKVKDLTARLAAADDDVTRRALLRALAVDARGVKVVAERFGAEADPALRRHLLTLLVLAGGRSANDALEIALGAPDAAERAHALALLPLAGVSMAKLLAPLAMEYDKKVRADAMRALAAAGEAKTLARAVRGDPARAIEAMRAVRAAAPDVGEFYRPLFSPWLGSGGDAGARNEAMRTLGARGDRRFLRHLTQLADVAGSAGVLTGWFRLAGGFGDAEAVGVVIATVEEGVAHAERALLTVAAEFGSAAALDWARRDGIAHDSPILRLAAVRILRAGGDGADVAVLRRALEDDDPLVALEAVEATGACTGADAGELLELLYMRAPGPVAAAALRELFRREAGAESAVDRAMGAAAGHQAWEVRAAALDLLRGPPAVGALAVIVAAFDDRVWRVRAAAYEAASTVRERRVVAALMERSHGETRPASGFLADALVELTRVDHGDEMAAWQRWWGIVAADFEVPEASGASARDRAGRARTTTSYYGIPIRSDNLVFIIDLSGSMTAEVGGRTKLEAAKEKLCEVLQVLQPTQRFGILAFGTSVGFYEEELVAATPADVESAVKWVQRLRIRGATNIYDSLELALQFEDVQSIFLLSDGGPSVGKFIDMGEIRRAVRLQNRDLRVRVNTILIGGSAREQAFMRKLAGENRGEVAAADGGSR